jgi:tyrosinase
VKTQEWFVNIAVNKFDLGSSFIVLIFLGDVPADSSTWKIASVGTLFVSTPPYYKKGARLTTHGEVALKEALKAANLSDHTEAGVIDYLTKNLQWKVQKTEGTVVHTSACSSLKISVHVEDVTYPTSEYGLPSYGNPVKHPEITKGKAGGA